MLRGKGLCDYVPAHTTGSTDQATSSKHRSEQKKDLALAYLSIDISCKVAVMTLWDPAAVLEKDKKFVSAVSDGTVHAIWSKHQHIKMGLEKQL